MNLFLAPASHQPPPLLTAISLPLQLRSRNAKHAHNLFMQCNVRLVTTVARKFEGRGVEMEDMMMEGTVGLGRAIELYDPAKGFRFSTYAYQWIRQAVGKSITEHGRIVRLPSHVFEVISWFLIVSGRDIICRCFEYFCSFTDPLCFKLFHLLHTFPAPSGSLTRSARTKL